MPTTSSMTLGVATRDTPAWPRSTSTPSRDFPRCSGRGRFASASWESADGRAKFWKVAADDSDEKVDYARIFPALRATGYDGWVSLEYEAEESEATGIPRALAYLKRMMEG